jgi:hypothetical protein
MHFRILFDERRALGLDDRPRNRESTGLLVEIRPAKGTELTSSRPRCRGKQQEASQVRVCTLGLCDQTENAVRFRRMPCVRTRGGRASEAGFAAIQPQRIAWLSALRMTA